MLQLLNQFPLQLGLGRKLEEKSKENKTSANQHPPTTILLKKLTSHQATKKLPSQ